MPTQEALSRVNGGVSDWYDRGSEIPARSDPVAPQKRVRYVCSVQIRLKGAPHHMSAMIVDRGDREEAHTEVWDEQDTGDEDWARKTLDQDCTLTKDRDNVVISETNRLPL
jgi:hypothetical protein